MAEFDPTTPKDTAEDAYARALLDDDAGREQRRARLMAALPRPQAVEAVPVSRAELAWRWQPYALGLLAAGLLLAAVLAWRGRPAEPRHEADPRLAAGPPASTATVVAQASPEIQPLPIPAAEAPRRPVRANAKASPALPRAAQPPPVVVADATPARPQRESEVSAPAAAEPATPAMAPPPAAPATVAAPAAPTAGRSEGLARSDSASNRAAAPLAAAKVAAAAVSSDAGLLAAVTRADMAATRAALQAGASPHLRDALGRTLLMQAARTGSREVVDLLLAAGARKADRDPQGWTAAEHAQSQGYGDLAERLR